MPIRILFVCTGNICRSPTAEHVFRARAAARGRVADFEVVSAGTSAWAGNRGADLRAIAAASDRGYDMTGHRTRGVRLEDFAAFDHIYAMDKSNLEWLRSECPKDQIRKVRLFLSETPACGLAEVPDPYVGAAGFERVLDLVESACDAILDRLGAP